MSSLKLQLWLLACVALNMSTESIEVVCNVRPAAGLEYSFKTGVK